MQEKAFFLIGKAAELKTLELAEVSISPVLFLKLKFVQSCIAYRSLIIRKPHNVAFLVPIIVPSKVL